jgi:hypothetical protein
MGTFEEVKADMLDRAKKAGACEDGYTMGMDACNKADLLKAVTYNWWWVLRRSKMIDAAYLEENFTEEELIAACIYTREEHRVSEIAFACDSATVKAYGSATVEACDSATVEAYDSATVKAYGSATVKAYDSATVEAYDSATVEACDSATVKAFGSATVKAYDNSYVEDYTGNIRHQSDYVIVKDYYKHKIYIKKGAFEIIEI